MVDLFFNEMAFERENKGEKRDGREREKKRPMIAQSASKDL